MKNKGILIVLLLSLLSFLIPMNLTAESTKLIYVIPVKKTIDPGLAEFIQRSYQEAQEKQADAVILEVDTPGGRIDAAVLIKDTILNSPLTSIAFVKGGAISAGALITLSCEKIGMQTGTTIGDAEPRLGNERADEKVISYFRKEMKATAETRGRDGQLAEAMVDRDIAIPEITEEGKILTLTYLEAEKYGFTDYVVKNRQELLQKLGFEGANVVQPKISTAEEITRFVTSPYVAPFLLTLGIAGVFIEILTMGWGIAGTVGIVSLILYFGGHLIAGFTGWWGILLFLAGIILLGIEIFIPGFGVFGISGIAALVVSVVLAAPTFESGLISLVIAIIGTFLLVVVSFKFLEKRKFWQRLVLGLKLNKEEGYIPQTKDLSLYVGQEGTVHSTLRPAGVVMLDKGERLDVVSEGEFILKGERVRIIRVEGMRIIVCSLK